MRVTAIFVLLVLLAVAAGQGAAGGAPARVSGEGAAGKNCVDEDGPVGEEAGDDASGPRRFHQAIFRRVFTLDAALDGVEGGTLPISVDEVCDLPKSLTRDARQLAGNDGIALLSPSTEISRGRRVLTGRRATAALGDADSAVLTVRLLRQRAWRKAEEEGRVPTFRTRQVDITD